MPITIRISAHGASLAGEFLNGPADHPKLLRASSGPFDESYLTAVFDYFARTLDATLKVGKLGSTYGPSQPGSRYAPTPFTAARSKSLIDPVSAPRAPEISGA